MAPQDYAAACHQESLGRDNEYHKVARAELSRLAADRADRLTPHTSRFNILSTLLDVE